MSDELHLSRRERQIMDIIHEREAVTAAEIRAAMPDAPGYSAVRALLRILEAKGYASHIRDGARYIYLPATPRTQAARAALTQVVQTFFGGSMGGQETGDAGPSASSRGRGRAKAWVRRGDRSQLRRLGLRARGGSSA